MIKLWVFAKIITKTLVDYGKQTITYKILFPQINVEPLNTKQQQ